MLQSERIALGDRRDDVMTVVALLGSVILTGMGHVLKFVYHLTSNTFFS